MIMADKIIALRKKNGWSQEELAEKLDVSRQAVSKWEGAQSTPDLEKVLKMSRLFGVSCDYLVKDEMEEIEYLKDADEQPGARRVSMEEADAFMRVKAYTAKRIAWATFLCVLSPICLFLLGAASQYPKFGISEALAGGLGLSALLLIVAAAVAMFVSCGAKTAPYEYLDKEAFDTEYGVTGMVRERQKQFRDAYNRANLVGACVCVVAAIPLLVGSLIWQDDLFMMGMLSLTLILAGLGAVCFIGAGVRWASMQKLLQEGEYEASEKPRAARRSAISVTYWLVAVAIYLGYSFLTDDWQRGWVVWPVAGVLYGALAAFLGAFERRAK